MNDITKHPGYQRLLAAMADVWQATQVMANQIGPAFSAGLVITAGNLRSYADAIAAAGIGDKEISELTRAMKRKRGGKGKRS